MMFQEEEFIKGTCVKKDDIKDIVTLICYKEENYEVDGFAFEF